MSIRFYQVDAFSGRPFAGNPAAVCLLDGARGKAWMQDVACEMNLSETAFAVPEERGFTLRWFTPVVEVEMCGHATLATAHVLWESGVLETDATARFFTRSGVLLARREGDLVEMDFPATNEQPEKPTGALVDALGVEPVYVGRTAFDLLVVVEDEATVRQLEPRVELLKEVPARGVIVTAEASTLGYDFVSRFFAPRVGINEDPVTGSAHCCLAPYWKTRTGRDEFTALQVSARGGVVRARVRDDRVILGGQAVTVVRGELLP